jgi:hypothetical protein
VPPPPPQYQPQQATLRKPVRRGKIYKGSIQSIRDY